jgi:hypothetical protein
VAALEGLNMSEASRTRLQYVRANFRRIFSTSQ